jgi:hypothetical protein
VQSSLAASLQKSSPGTLGGASSHVMRNASRSFVSKPYAVPMAAHDLTKKAYEEEELLDLGLEDGKEE